MVGYLYDELFTKHDTGAHIENKDRVISIDESLRGMGLFKLRPQKATIEELEEIHDPRYLEWVKDAYSKGYRHILNEDTVLSPDSYEVALYAAGSGKSAIDAVKAGMIKRAFLNIRPPGHHAERNTGQGFCIFNNIALAARYAQKSGFEKVLIIDFDVHHGNGTQDIFYDDDTVCFFSTHEKENYPYFTGAQEEIGVGKGKGYNINRPYGNYCEDEELLNLYEDLPTWFDPDILLISAGYDLMADESISTARISFDGLRSLVRKILDFASDRPAIFFLEGGYNIESLSKSVYITVEEMLEYGL